MSARRFWTVVLAAGIVFASAAPLLQAQIKLPGKIGQATQKAKDALEVAKTVRSGFADITEEEEYYIGRAVAALILARYPALDNPALNQYLNVLGNAVALSSDRPEIYAGWHFLVLDTDEVNALAAPGGMIFVTKGLLVRCQDEEMLGLILAHEIGHVAAKHGLQSIKKARLTEVFTTLGAKAAQAYGPAELAQLTSIFEGVLSDIVEKLVVNGYDRKYEHEADSLGVRFGAAAGYDPNGIVRFLQTMVGDKTAVSGKGWFKTHPTPEQRLDKTKGDIGKLGAAPAIEDVRTQRFQQAVASLK
jgi:predicted Zn-dependent protease